MYCNLNQAINSADETTKLVRDVITTAQENWQDAQAQKFKSLYMEEIEQQMKANIRLLKDIEDQINWQIREL